MVDCFFFSLFFSSFSSFSLFISSFYLIKMYHTIVMAIATLHGVFFFED